MLTRDGGETSSDKDALNERLVMELDGLGVKFLRASRRAEGLPPGSSGGLTPAGLLNLLAASQEARLRLAIIPLLLHRPDFATALDEVEPLTASAGLTLWCYYTAAFYLQQKYRARLARLGAFHGRLPDLFSVDLGLTMCADPDIGLLNLARRHAELSGKPINWLGTYEHAARQWLAALERGRQRMGLMSCDLL
jgi:hypothetical protein